MGKNFLRFFGPYKAGPCLNSLWFPGVSTEVTYSNADTKVVSENRATRSLAAAIQCWLSGHPSDRRPCGALLDRRWPSEPYTDRAATSVSYKIYFNYTTLRQLYMQNMSYILNIFCTYIFFVWVSFVDRQSTAFGEWEVSGSIRWSPKSSMSALGQYLDG